MIRQRESLLRMGHSLCDLSPKSTEIGLPERTSRLNGREGRMNQAPRERIYYKTLSKSMYTLGKVLDTSIYNYALSVGQITERDADICLRRHLRALQGNTGIARVARGGGASQT